VLWFYEQSVNLNSRRLYLVCQLCFLYDFKLFSYNEWFSLQRNLKLRQKTAIVNWNWVTLVNKTCNRKKSFKMSLLSSIIIFHPCYSIFPNNTWVDIYQFQPKSFCMKSAFWNFNFCGDSFMIWVKIIEKKKTSYKIMAREKNW
jgi:hypothetical protein